MARTYGRLHGGAPDSKRVTRTGSQHVHAELNTHETAHRLELWHDDRARWLAVDEGGRTLAEIDFRPAEGGPAGTFELTLRIDPAKVRAPEVNKA